MLVAGMRIPEQMRAAVLQMPGEFDKGTADRLLPIAPEFALFLMETPEITHTGPVFRLEGQVSPPAATDRSFWRPRATKSATAIPPTSKKQPVPV